MIDCTEDPFVCLLKSLSGQHVHYFSNPGNAGDGFIAYATYELFKKYGITYTGHKCTDVVEGQKVLIGGGGNLVERRYQQVADIVRRHADTNEIYVLPHTIVGYPDILAETHRNLTIFCRDPVSHRLALLNGAKPDRVHLSKDITLFLDPDHFSEFFESGAGTLKALRVDGESAGTIPIDEGNIDISLSWNGDLWASAKFAKHATRSMAAFIAPYKTVMTDRLHVSILASLLRKKVFLLPNAYFKNRAIFEYALKTQFENLDFINTLNVGEEALGPMLVGRSLISSISEATDILNIESVSDLSLRVAELEISLEACRRESEDLSRELANEKRHAIELDVERLANTSALTTLTSRYADLEITLGNHREEREELRLALENAEARIMEIDAEKSAKSSAHLAEIAKRKKLERTFRLMQDEWSEKNEPSEIKPEEWILSSRRSQAAADRELEQLKTDLATREQYFEGLISQITEDRTRLVENVHMLNAAVKAAELERSQLKERLTAVMNSTSWRVSSPMRFFAMHLPGSLRKIVAGAIRPGSHR